MALVVKSLDEINKTINNIESTPTIHRSLAEVNLYLNGGAPGIYRGIAEINKVFKSGTQTFITGGIFTVPPGIYSVDICEVAGGGSGYAISGAPLAGGGFSGEVISQAVDVTPGQEVTVVIGIGGAAIVRTSGFGEGNDGTDTSFGAIVATGGLGGTISTYAGDGAERVTCGGTFYDGAADASTYGGEASSFGDGGFGDTVVTGDVQAQDGVSGSGGGGASTENSSNTATSGKGGDGKCIVTWSIE